MRCCFTDFVNQKFGTNMTWNQVRDLYNRKCGSFPDYCSTQPVSGLTLCGRSEPVFGPVVLDDISNCSDSSFYAVSKGTELYNVYSDSLNNVFDSSYRSKCLQAYKYERFTVTHKNSEYHYTLYYYDQAGNLLKTVPPAEVRANYDSLWLDSVATARSLVQTKVPVHTLITQYTITPMMRRTG